MLRGIKFLKVQIPMFLHSQLIYCLFTCSKRHINTSRVLWPCTCVTLKCKEKQLENINTKAGPLSITHTLILINIQPQICYAPRNIKFLSVPISIFLLQQMFEDVKISLKPTIWQFTTQQITNVLNKSTTGIFNKLKQQNHNISTHFLPNQTVLH